MGLFIFQIFQMFFNGASANVCGGEFQFVLAAVFHDLGQTLQHAQGETVADGKDFQFFRTDNGRCQKHQEDETFFHFCFPFVKKAAVSGGSG